MRATAGRTHRKTCLVMFSQGGKSEAILDLIGHRLDTAPVPILYVGPTKKFIDEQWEPRIEDLIDEAPAIAAKVASDKSQTKSRKVIAGVPLRLAHAGSSSALKSDPAGLAVTDEVEELLANVKGSGNPIRLIDDRGKTHADFVHALTSTPGEGLVDVKKDKRSGLEFWEPGDADEVTSMIWRIWQSGTRHHFALPCPHCDEFFIPRLNMLEWKVPQDKDGRPQRPTTALARKTAHINCPSCGCEITDDDRDGMIAKGEMIAPGQWFEKGKVKGHPPDVEVISYWVSGLANPFESLGDMAAKYVDAENSGDPEELRVVVNGTFGELYAPGGGTVPEWTEVAKLTDERDEGDLPNGLLKLVLTVDVQQDCLYYVLRGWGARATSWLIEAGQLFGKTNRPAVWDKLQDVLDTTYGRKKIARCFIDSGFNPNGKDFLPINRIYSFCAKNRRICYPTKGHATLSKPLVIRKPDVKRNGDVDKYGLQLIHLDTDHWKSWVHERVRWPENDPGEWRLYNGITEDYCRQVVSEARVVVPGSKPKWVARSKANHYFDCEAMNAAVAFMFNMHKIRTKAERGVERDEAKERKQIRGKRPRPEPKPETKAAARKPKKQWAILN